MVWISDRDKRFVEGFWKGLFTALRTKLLYTAAYHPSADGQSERFKPSKENCWAWLETLWGEDRMVEWKAQLLTGGMVDTEQVSNLITLEIQAHEHWDSANFAFRPVCINETYK